MGILSTASFCKWDNFIQGAHDGIFTGAHFSPRNTSKKHPVEVCDLIITADTETSHISTGDTWAEYHEPPEVEYLKGIKLKCTPAVKAEFSDFEYIRRKAFGLKIYLSNKGRDIEETYAELVRLFGWSRTLVNPADMVSDIIDFMDEQRTLKEAAEAEQDAPEVGWVYQWSICVYNDPESPLFIYGRKPEEMTACFSHMAELLKLNKHKKLSVYFHHFAYDYQYLKKHITRDLDAGADLHDEFRILATAPHKLISWQTTSGITFKCSYRLSNASLDFWAKKIVFSKHKKLTGTIDYEIVRFQDSPLTFKDWRYMFYDVLVEAECIKKAADSEGDSMATIPLTSTGYVRRDGRRLFKKDKNARKEFQKSSIGARCYKVLKAAQAGGYTHTSRFIAGRTLDVESADFKKEYPEITGIKHGDMRSFYPSMQQVETYPVSRFICYSKMPDKAKVQHFLSDDTHKYLFVVCFNGATLKPGQPFPVISESKAYQGRIDKLDIIDDNGRVLQAKGSFILCLTELDFKLILKQYETDFTVLEVWRAKAGRLPGWMLELIHTYFKSKSDLKVKTKLEPDNFDLAALLMKDKNKLNGIYGMSATDIVRDSFIEDEHGEWKRVPADATKELLKYYSNGNSFMRLEWGVYCTSWSRYRLIELAEVIGWRYVLYSDTDSIFYLYNDEIGARVDAWNKEHEARALKIGAYIMTEQGKRISYDCFEDEGEDIVQFRALHSKCYAYVLQGGRLKCTIAGVATKGREKELASIDNLSNGFTFHKCGGTTIKYYEEEISHADIDGHHITYEGSAIICKTDKTIKFNPYEFTEDRIYESYTEDELKP